MTDRLTRLSSDQIPSGLLPVGDAAALAEVGFEPLGEVIGAYAAQVTPGKFYVGTPFYPPYGIPPANAPLTVTSSSRVRAVSRPRTITALKDGFRTTLTRLQGEARARGADGVVGIRVEVHDPRGSGTHLWTFLAVGTAVRSTGTEHTGSPFTTDLSGAQTAAALRRGWMPVALIRVPVMATRPTYPGLRQPTGRYAGNVEHDALTDVVNTCRRQARDDFRAEAQHVGADGAVLSEMTLEVDSSAEESDAFVTITGTALARFRTGTDTAAPLVVVPLKGRSL